MKTLLKIIFIFFLAAIAYGTITATLQDGVITAWKVLWPYAWFKATLVDTYCAFMTIYLWIFYKETSWAARVFWFLAIVGLGTFAYASYILIQLFRLKPEEPLKNLLLRRGSN